MSIIKEFNLIYTIKLYISLPAHRKYSEILTITYYKSKDELTIATL